MNAMAKRGWLLCVTVVVGCSDVAIGPDTEVPSSREELVREVYRTEYSRETGLFGVAFHLDEHAGAWFLGHVEPGSDAAAAGLVGGEWLRAIDGTAIDPGTLPLLLDHGEPRVSRMALERANGTIVELDLVVGAAVKGAVLKPVGCGQGYCLRCCKEDGFEWCDSGKSGYDTCTTNNFKCSTSGSSGSSA